MTKIAGAHGVEVNVTAQLEQVGLVLYEQRLVAALEQMPDATMATIQGLGSGTEHRRTRFAVDAP